MSSHRIPEKKITFIGAGAIGTALGNILAGKKHYAVTLHSIEEEVVDSINRTGINTKYFPMNPLQPALRASQDNNVFRSSEVIFLAIPSVVMIDYLRGIRDLINGQAILVNLAKGFGQDNSTITACIRDEFRNRVCTLKGPTFAREIINQLPSAFTLGTADNTVKEEIGDLFKGTNVHLDFSDDIQGVEILSILKNIYAIVIGIVDAHFNSPNLRSLVLTRAFSEMRDILLFLGGREETMFRYCGIGDFTHTALNDLSRNRTLGLLIGKGFFTEHVSHDLVLEGKSAVGIIHRQLDSGPGGSARFPLIHELYQVLEGNYPIGNFINNILSHE
jgi:glycerol-3-phosphate dehydrogenase (NAD(P)+)